MSINSISNSSYYSTTSTYSSKKSETKTEEELAELIGSQPTEKPEGPPPPKPPEEEDNLENETYSVEDLTSYLDYISNEYGISVDATEFTEGKESFTGAEIKSFLEENGLEFSTKKAPQEEPPIINSTDEQLSIMAQMQSTSAINPQTFSLSNYLDSDEESEESSEERTTTSKIENASTSSSSTQSLEDLLLNAYSSMYSQNTYQQSIFSV